MGLTISYELTTRRKLDLAGVRRLTETLRAAAIERGAETVSDLIEVGPGFHGAFHIPKSARTAADVLSPAAGWLCSVTPGDGCESFFLGLCRYEGVPGWRLRDFPKTQYASRHGWEHFLKCHRMVIDLLRAAQNLGLQVKVLDEGRLWDTGSESILREEIAKHDRMMAAVGGALKDIAGEQAKEIQGAIFSDPRFERLEAEGQREYSRQLRRLRRHGADLLQEG